MTDDTDDFLFAQHVGLNSPDVIFAFWGSVAWVPLISFYFSGVQPHLGAPQGDNVIIPTDELIFFRGVGQPPTRWIWLWL